MEQKPNTPSEEVRLCINADEEVGNEKSLHHPSPQLPEEADAPSCGKKMNADLDKKWVDKVIASIECKRGVKTSIRDLDSGYSFPIQWVPRRFRKLSDHAYVPQLISIGPFHYNKRSNLLRVMEDHKMRFMNAILDRNGRECLEQCLMAVTDREDDAQKYYSHGSPLEKNDFVQMMVFDGCFIIELFSRASPKFSNQFADDPILNDEYTRRRLMIDLLKLENQIPFFILQSLCKPMKIDPTSLVPMALEFFKSMLPDYRSCAKSDVHIKHFLQVPKIESNSNSNSNFKHLLHLLYTCVVPPKEEGLKLNKSTNTGMHKRIKIHSASELRQAGFEFKLNCGAKSFFEINFHKGVIEIPPLYFEEWATSIFMNLLVFEQCFPLHTQYISAYTIFMDLLINNAKDVRILYESGIIKRWLGSNEDLAAIFNKLGKEITLYSNDLYLCDLFEEIEHHYSKIWVVWRASLTRIYFNNPWAIISVIVAILLQLLTLLQPYFHK